jgi:hypothetical protein
MTGDLQRMLRRVRAGALPESLLELAITREIERLLNAAAGDQHPGPELLPAADVEADLMKAHRALAVRRFAAAIAALGDARTALALRHRQEHARAEHEALRAERDRRVRELDLDEVIGSATWRIVDRLLRLGAALLGAQQPQRAAAVSRICRRMLASLMAQRTPPDPDVTLRLERLHERWDTIAGCSRARELARQGYSNLASRLADEIDIEISRRQLSPGEAKGEHWRSRVAADLAATARAAADLNARLAREIAAIGES